MNYTAKEQAMLAFMRSVLRANSVRGVRKMTDGEVFDTFYAREFKCVPFARWCDDTQALPGDCGASGTGPAAASAPSPAASPAGSPSAAEIERQNAEGVAALMAIANLGGPVSVGKSASNAVAEPAPVKARTPAPHVTPITQTGAKLCRICGRALRSDNAKGVCSKKAECEARAKKATPAQ
jgi:hypothetical protein